MHISLVPRSGGAYRSFRYDAVITLGDVMLVHKEVAMGLKNDLALGALTLLLGGLTYVSHAYETPARAEADLTCADVECGGAASCGTSGKENACVLSCSDGNTITCKPKVEG